MCNLDVRQAAASAGVRLWQIANAIGLNDGNFSRKLRKELPAEEKRKIFGIIERLAKEGC
nr:MAG TPA: RK RWP-RK domain [Caudoviricetes sp.]